jgi:hypothetical protein
MQTLIQIAITSFKIIEKQLLKKLKSSIFQFFKAKTARATVDLSDNPISIKIKYQSIMVGKLIFISYPHAPTMLSMRTDF